jgi:hypothetical protein
MLLYAVHLADEGNGAMLTFGFFVLLTFNFTDNDDGVPHWVLFTAFLLPTLTFLALTSMFEAESLGRMELPLESKPKSLSESLMSDMVMAKK